MYEKLLKLAKGKNPDEGILGIQDIAGRNSPAKRLQADLLAAGISLERHGWHSFRKLFVTSIVQLKTDAKTRRTLSRHSDDEINLDTYTMLDADALQEASEDIVDMLLEGGELI